MPIVCFSLPIDLYSADFSDLPYLKEERKSFFQLKTQNVIKITSRQKILSNGVGEVVT